MLEGTRKVLFGYEGALIGTRAVHVVVLGFACWGKGPPDGDVVEQRISLFRSGAWTMLGTSISRNINPNV